jgi:predicted alpha/beta-hydrolase family hydrolase
MAATTAWDRPAGDPRAVLVLAHGAGGNLEDSFLRGLGARLAERGAAVLRFNFPYRDAGRRMPGAASESEAAYREVADAARMPGVPLFIGGKSYGGRIATHIAAAGYPCDGLVLLSYPLHPPGRTDKLRVEHLGRMEVPMLVVRGTNDAFSQQELFDAHVRSLPRVEVVDVEGGDHSLRVRGRKADDVLDQVARAVSSFVGT